MSKENIKTIIIEELYRSRNSKDRRVFSTVEQDVSKPFEVKGRIFDIQKGIFEYAYEKKLLLYSSNPGNYEIDIYIEDVNDINLPIYQ